MSNLLNYIGGEYALGEIEKFSAQNNSSDFDTFFPAVLNKHFISFFETGSDALCQILIEIDAEYGKGVKLWIPENFCMESIDRVLLKLKGKNIKCFVEKSNHPPQFLEEEVTNIFLLMHFNNYNEELINISLECKQKFGFLIVEDFVQAPFDINKTKGDYSFNSLRKIGNIEVSIAYKKKTFSSSIKPSHESTYYLTKKKACELKSKFFKTYDKNLEKQYLKLFKDAESYLSNASIYHAVGNEINVLREIDWSSVLQKRKKNYDYLFRLLSKNKKLKILNGGYMYLMIIIDNRNALKNHLATQHIYSAVHWLDSKSAISNSLLSLPIDQRYSFTDMDRIANSINIFTND